jgi:hypothetical protein
LGTYLKLKLLCVRQFTDEVLFGDQAMPVTTTFQRVEQMLEALNRITDGRGSSMFLFTDEAALAANNPLDVEWMSGNGELIRLTD